MCPTLGRVKPGLLGKTLVTCNSEPVMVFKNGDGWNHILYGRHWVIWDELAPLSVSTLFLRNRSNRVSGFQGSCPVNDCSHAKSV